MKLLKKDIVKLDFELEPQKESRLCWAAISVSIARFFNKKNEVTQIDFAKKNYGTRYNRFCQPEKALSYFGNFRKEINQPLDFNEIVQELNKGRPVVACMKFFVGWHLVVIYGASNDNQLFIADPLNGNSKYSYDDFKNEYINDYHWTHTYLIKKE